MSCDHLWCDRALGTWDQTAAPASELQRLDWLDLKWDQCHRRAIQGITRGGQKVRVLLRVGTTLRHLDILADTPDRLIVVHVNPIETLVVHPRSAEEAAMIALEWGNLHVPVEITPTEIVTLADGPALGAAEQHGVDHSIQLRRFHPMRISGVSWKTADSGQPANPLSKLNA